MEGKIYQLKVGRIEERSKLKNNIEGKEQAWREDEKAEEESLSFRNVDAPKNLRITQ